MVRPEFPVDEDWEIHLYDQDKDHAWEVDSSQNKRYYVGSCGFEKLDPVTGRRTSLRIFCGRIRMLISSPRFQANPRVFLRSGGIHLWNLTQVKMLNLFLVSQWIVHQLGSMWLRSEERRVGKECRSR